jgi:hypothetical protein
MGCHFKEARNVCADLKRILRYTVKKGGWSYVVYLSDKPQA